MNQINKYLCSDIKKENKNRSRSNNAKISDIIQNIDKVGKEGHKEMRLSFNHLTVTKDQAESDLNDIPYTKALRIDKRNFLLIFIVTFLNKVDITDIIFFRDEFEFLTVSINVFLLDESLELFFNALFYNDDVISQKYHSNGKLDFVTEQLLSLISNIISYLIMKLLSKLVSYSEYFSLIQKEIKEKDKLVEAVELGLKLTRRYMIIFSIITLALFSIIIYYLSVFSAVYPKSQTSFFKNFGLGELQSLVFNFIVAFFVAIFRKLSLKYRIRQLYETSKFIDNLF